MNKEVTFLIQFAFLKKHKTF